MSLLSLATIQLGKSLTSTLNFTFRNLLDGALRFSRGNADGVLQDVIRIESNNDIALAGNLLSGVFGTGQTWQDKTGSRSKDVTYTNSTGRPIQVAIMIAINTGQTASFFVNGVVVRTATSGGGAWADGVAGIVIPAGHTYLLTGTNAPYHWAELRL